MIDYAENTRKIHPASDFPVSIQFKNRKRTIDGKDVVMKVPVREIRVRSLNREGDLVGSAKATIINIQYLDSDGDVLESTTMKKN